MPLSVRSPPLCPELSLWLLAPEVDLDQAIPELCIEPTPYWAFCWGAGQALARLLLDEPERVRGRRVVDFGAGCGVAGIAAALAGARTVVACDLDADARSACLANASLNRVALEISAELPPAPACDLLLASDVCYEADNARRLLELASAGVDVLISDPGRRPLPRAHLEPLREREVRTFPDVDAPYTRAVVYRVLPEPRPPLPAGSD
jgi:predicted nicotinamide N-methyase